MKKSEPVQKRRGIRVAALGAVFGLVLLAGGQPATAASKPPPVSLTVAAPSTGATVADTTQLEFTGTNLSAVKVYRLTTLVATATVSAGGTRATALLDTARFSDGPLLLTAVGWGTGSGLPRAVAPLLVRVDNAGTDHHLAGYRLAFHDEFSGGQLDRSLWCTRYMYDGGPALETPDPSCLWTQPDTGTVFGTLDTLGGNGTYQGQESEVYRDFNVNGEKLHAVQDGYLALRATATRLDQPYLKYESAMIRSKRQFQPTTDHPLYLTARMKQPDVLGTWPAFWLAGGFGELRPPWPPEIDILEGPLNNSGQYANMMHTGVQAYGCDGPCPQGPFDYTYTDSNFDPVWGNYTSAASMRAVWIEVGLEWHTDHVCWYFNGIKTACQLYKWVANEGPAATNPATVLLNLAVGGPWAGADGVDNAKFPTEFDVDHVRIYRG